jgi:hypothetical protein
VEPFCQIWQVHFYQQNLKYQFLAHSATLSKMPRVLMPFLRLGFLLYNVIAITYRLAFLPAFAVYSGVVGALLFDCIADFFFLLDNIFKILTAKNNVVKPALDDGLRKRSTAGSTASPCNGNLETGTIGSTSSRVSRIGLTNGALMGHKDVEKIASLVLQQKSVNLFCAKFDWVFQLVASFPFELIGYASGFKHYYILRSVRLLRLLYFNVYWQDIIDILERYRIVTTAGTQRIALLALIMALISHVFACFFYAIALWSVNHDNMNNWLFYDGLASVSDNGNVILHHPVSFRYLRAIYWSIQTNTSITFGDIVAHSQAETWFCIVYFLITAALIYFSVANLTMVITNFDSARTENLLKIIKFEKYAAYRQLPPALTSRVVSYYQHQWQSLQGVDENMVRFIIPRFLFCSFQILICFYFLSDYERIT